MPNKVTEGKVSISDSRASLILATISALFSLSFVFVALDSFGIITLGPMESFSFLSLLGVPLGIVALVIIFRQPREARSKTAFVFAWLGAIIPVAFVMLVIAYAFVGLFVQLPIFCLKNGQC